MREKIDFDRIAKDMEYPSPTAMINDLYEKDKSWVRVGLKMGISFATVLKKAKELGIESQPWGAIAKGGKAKDKPVCDRTPKKWPVGWSTANEIDFFDQLMAGTTSPYIQSDPEDLCRGYIRHFKNRIRWDTIGAMTGAEVLAHAMACLERMEG